MLNTFPTNIFHIKAFITYLDSTWIKDWILVHFWPCHDHDLCHLTLRLSEMLNTFPIHYFDWQISFLALFWRYTSKHICYHVWLCDDLHLRTLSLIFYEMLNTLPTSLVGWQYFDISHFDGIVAPKLPFLNLYDRAVTLTFGPSA